MQQTGLFHNVFFWLTEGSDAGQLAEACKALSSIPTVLRLTIGFPSGTAGPVVEKSYSVALLIEFADEAGHDVYDAHPDHQHFVQTWTSHFSRVQVFDVAAG